MYYGDKMHPYSLHNDIMGAAIKLMKSINLKCLQLQKSSEVKGKSDETFIMPKYFRPIGYILINFRFCLINKNVGIRCSSEGFSET